ncbi:hypothetical protein VNO80_20008 [Phaseolus coccineus]|uniref:Thiamine pyrophosphate enzyme central domain-containing protein n=1 Tax=Phaseolus coccineus TaxID=3886 RepID=A0AAN9R5F1_PHACN
MRKGADILVEALERHGVTTVFAWREEINVQKEKFPLSYKLGERDGDLKMHLGKAEYEEEAENGATSIPLMLGMHGTVYANYTVDKSDLLLAFGIRFDDRVTGKIEAFASRAKIVHIDIDSAELRKIKQPHVSVCGDLKLALQAINRILEDMGVKGKLDLGAWREEINVQKEKFPLSYKTFDDRISPQYAIEVLDELTNGDC